MLYLHWIASEDVETQQKGIVIIAWPTNEDGEDGGEDDIMSSWEKNITPKFNKRLRTLQKQMAISMPVRMVSQQAFFPDTTFFRTMSALYYVGMNSYERPRYKAHFGEYNPWSVSHSFCLLFLGALLPVLRSLTQLP